MSCVQCSSVLAEGARICPACRALQPLRVHRGSIGPGETIDLGYGRVVVEERLGEGGMGVVFRAWLFFAPGGPRASSPPVPLALKVLSPHAGENHALRALFANEAEALRTLRHPNIVAFHDFFEWGRTVALAMELVSGSTLEALISRHRARSKIAGGAARPGVPPARAWYYFQQLLGALAATHAMGVVHRDVKPSNVFVRGDGIVKLGDYGIAHALPESPLPSSEVGAGTYAVGTGAYMSPEQVLSRPIGPRSDLYSAAIVLYELLAGRPPFSPDDKSEFALRHEQVEATPPPLRTFAADASVELEALLARALAKDPRYRFSSAIEMGQAVRVALGERETPEWRAEVEIAGHAPFPHDLRDQGARERRLLSLRERVMTGYQAANPSRASA